MIPVLHAKQIREVDAYTIRHTPIASIDLMERACLAFANWFHQQFPEGSKVHIFCGTGNNGGDGLGAARRLIEKGYDVSAYIVGEANPSQDFSINLKRLEEKIKVKRISGPHDLPEATNTILVDALFGSGLSRAIDGIHAAVIEWMNIQNATRVAIDIPSGLMADKPSEGPTVCAHQTATFQLPKLAFLLPESFQYVGDWTVLDIGLDASFIQQQDCVHFVIEEKDIRALLKKRYRFDHKGTYGKALLICGGYGKMGAAVLAARAALRSGVGLVVTHVPSTGYPIVQTGAPEAMASVDKDPEKFTTVPDLDGYSAVGVGPGIGTAEVTARALAALMKAFDKPMVIDADALNILSDSEELLHLVPRQSVLTPHPGEFGRLAGQCHDDFARLTLQGDLAKKTNSIILVKGAFTTVAAPNGMFYFNPTGNPGMATGGMGDVLTGFITGLLAQGYGSLQATLLGTYLHGLAGDLAAGSTGYEALTASDVIGSLSSAFLAIRPKT